MPEFSCFLQAASFFFRNATKQQSNKVTTHFYAKLLHKKKNVKKGVYFRGSL